MRWQGTGIPVQPVTLTYGSNRQRKIRRKSANLWQNSARRVNFTIKILLTHEHVLKELELYSPLVTKGSYLMVFDTVIEDMPDDFFPDRPWDK